jgi:hypothetical protein
MRYLKYFLLAVFLPFFNGCTEEPAAIPISEDGLAFRNSEVREVPVKFRGKTYMDESSDPTFCGEIPFYSKGYAYGQMSHVGKVYAELNPWEIKSCSATDMVIEGAITAPNGDALLYTIYSTVNVNDGSISGYLEIYDGTGKFENATGTIDFTYGAITETTVTPAGIVSLKTELEGEGTLKYLKDN